LHARSRSSRGLSERDLPPLPALAPDAHKGDAGRVLAIVGSETMAGAAVLVARAAQRAGAGLVAVGCVDANLFTILPCAAPEAVLVDLRPGFTIDGRANARAADLLEARAPHVRVVGCGLGLGARTRALVALALEGRGTAALVLDADGLNALDGRPERLAGRPFPLVITPHPGEAERLFGARVPRDARGRAAFARGAARRAGAIVVLKGRGSVVSDGERTYVNASGNPGLATAGAGDVLAGVLAAYLARASADPRPGLGAFEATCLAVLAHGLAGDLALRSLGQRALVASDIIDSLGAAQRRLERRRRPGGRAG
jgi:NAD(P)H-hydrate epimerase